MNHTFTSYSAGVLPLNDYHIEWSGLCILRIHDIFSACVVWFTFVSRKQEHLAVGSSGRGLTRSRGHPHFVVASPSPFVPLLYHNLGDLSRGFLKFFSRKFVSRMVGATQLPRTVRPPEGSQLLGGSLPLTPLVYHRPHTKSTGNNAQIRDFFWL